MAKQTSKAELLRDIQAERARFERLLSAISPTDMTLPGVVGVWSIKDILAHLAAWERLFMHWYACGRDNIPPEPTPVAMSRKAMFTMNEQIYQCYQHCSLESVLVEFHASFVEILSTLQAIPEQDMFAKALYAWTGKLRLVDYIAGNTCNHYRWATSKIHRWSKTRHALLP